MPASATQSARRRVVAREAATQADKQDAAPNGWMVMDALDLLVFHDQTKKLPNRGLTTYDAGEQPNDDDDSAPWVRVYGTERDGVNLKTSLVAVMLTGEGDAFQDTLLKLEKRAEKAGLPFSPDDGVAHVGTNARDYAVEDRNTPEKVIEITAQAEDAMASFIRGAREAGLLKGVTINVPDLSQN